MPKAVVQRWVGGALVIAMMLMVSYFVTKAIHPSSKIDEALINPAAVITTPPQSVGLPSVPAGVPQVSNTLAVSASSSSSQSESNSVSLSSAAREVEVCGYGKVREDRDKEKLEATFAALERNTRKQVMDALNASGQYPARAVGLYLGLSYVDDGRGIGEKCAEGASCASPDQKSQVLQEQQRYLDELVRLAAESQDPIAYAIGLQACIKFKKEEQCKQLTLERWSQLDPHNAVPWLSIAQQANASGKKDVAIEALHHAAQANTVDSYGYAILATAMPYVSDKLTPLERRSFLTNVVGLEAAWSLNYYAPIAKTGICSADNLNKSYVRADCEAIASLLVNKGPLILDIAIGRSLGERLGWPSIKVAQISQEINAIQETLAWMPTGQDLSCSGVQVFNERMTARATLSEVGFARATIEQSGVPIQDLALKRAQRMADTAAKNKLQEEAKRAQ